MMSARDSAMNISVMNADYTTAFNYIKKLNFKMPIPYFGRKF